MYVCISVGVIIAFGKVIVSKSFTKKKNGKGKGIEECDKVNAVSIGNSFVDITMIIPRNAHDWFFIIYDRYVLLNHGLNGFDGWWFKIEFQDKAKNRLTMLIWSPVPTIGNPNW